jgi:Lrp/AsnC family transcriptional regulator for asnA, asnC and gidA
VDELDFQILTQLLEDARRPFDAVGRAVSLSGNAVKARVQNMENEGVLKGFFASPAPALLGMKVGILVFQNVEDLDEREARIVKGMGEIGPVRFMDVTLDRSVMVSVLYRDEEHFAEIEKRATALVGKPPGHCLGCPGCATEEARDLKLSLVDWRIVRSLRRDGRKALKEVVEETGASFKTVKKRLDTLLAKEALHIQPVISTSEASGLVLFNLVVFLESAKFRHAVSSALPKPSWAWPMDDPPGVHVTLIRPNLKAAKDAHHLVQTLPGVTRAYFKIGTRYVYDGWVDDEIARRIRALEEARLGPRVPAAAAAAAAREPAPMAPLAAAVGSRRPIGGGSATRAS